MSSSLLIERIEYFIKSKVYLEQGEKPPSGEIIESGPRGGKYYNSSERKWGVGFRGKLNIGEFVVTQELPNKYLIKITGGQFKGKHKYIPKTIGEEVKTAPMPEELVTHQEIKKPEEKLTGFPEFIDKKASRRIKKLLIRNKLANYLTNHPAKVVKELQGGHKPKKIKFNGIEGVFKSVGSLKDNKWANNRKSLLKEVCSFELSKILRFNFVPPTTVKTMGDNFGSVQQFIPGKLGLEFDKSQRQKIFNSPEGKRLAIFDFIIGNRDRHARNWIYDEASKKIWAIDNGNVFPTDKDALHVLSGFINKEGNPLDREEVNMLIKKRDRIIRYINSYCGSEIAQGATKRIDYMIKNKKIKSYALGESK